MDTSKLFGLIAPQNPTLKGIAHQSDKYKLEYMAATLPKLNMLNIGEVAETVQKNCHISDARYAGNYSMCIFLLKMREYYRWENDLPLTVALSKDDVGPWLQEREETWNHYEELPYQPIALPIGETDPFDNETINQELNPLGYVYSSGYGVFNKPHFFLAKLKQKREQDGLTILISDCEYARDLVAPPAMLLGNTIYIRHESLRRMIWEKVENWQWKKDFDAPLARALACYAGHDSLDSILDKLCENETQNVILHELGEAQAGKLLGTAWEEMLFELSRSKTELQIRAVRDHLADCLTTLPQLIHNKHHASLHFYFANFTGMRKEIFPQAMRAYQDWASYNTDAAFKILTEQGARHWLRIAKQILQLHQNKDPDFTNKVDSLLLTPLSM